MTEPLRAPFPYFGGKRRVADEVWRRLGDPPNYVEPFFGSGAVFLARPAFTGRRTETLNDADGLVVNFWRALAADPEGVAAACNWPVTEVDYHARLAYIQGLRSRFTARMEADPDLYDTRLAGWWVYVACAGIGDPWGAGPWHVIDGELQKNSNAGQGINRELPHLGDAGQGINRALPHLGDAGRGILAEFRRLSDRFRRSRITCGDYRRVLTPIITERHGTTGIYLDPPYSHGADLYAGTGDTEIYRTVTEWCADNGDNPKLRIAVSGYEGDHDDLEAHGWDVYAWKAHGGYGGGRGGIGDLNAHRERIWFSPHCVAVDKQHDLFSDEATA